MIYAFYPIDIIGYFVKLKSAYFLGNFMFDA